MNIAGLTPTVGALAYGGSDERILPWGELPLVRIAILAEAMEDAVTDWRMVALI